LVLCDTNTSAYAVIENFNIQGNHFTTRRTVWGDGSVYKLGKAAMLFGDLHAEMKHVDDAPGLPANAAEASNRFWRRF
jgi:hypothetical protein